MQSLGRDCVVNVVCSVDNGLVHAERNWAETSQKVILYVIMAMQIQHNE